MNESDTRRVSKAIIVYDGKVLLLHPKDKQKWHLPGGHLKGDETFLDGVKREVFEETGLKCTSIRSISKSHDFELFFCKTSCNNVKLSKEHTEYKWVDIHRAIDKMLITKETKRDLLIAKSKLLDKSFAVIEKKKKKKQEDDVDLEE